MQAGTTISPCQISRKTWDVWKSRPPTRQKSILLHMLTTPLLCLAVSGCARQDLDYARTQSPEEKNPWLYSGAIHGAISPLMLVASLTGKCSVYAVPNSGLGYDMGFALGVVFLAFVVGFVKGNSVAKRRARSKVCIGVSLAVLAIVGVLAGCEGRLIPHSPEAITAEEAQCLRRMAAEAALLEHDRERMAIRQRMDSVIGPDPTPYSKVRDHVDRASLEFDTKLRLRREKQQDRSRWPMESGIIHAIFAPVSVAVQFIPGIDPKRGRYYNYPNSGFLYDLLFVVGTFLSCGSLPGWIGYRLGCSRFGSGPDLYQNA